MKTLEIQVIRNSAGVKVKYAVDGKNCSFLGASRAITNTNDEDKGGLFSPKIRHVRFYRGDIMALVDFSDVPFPARPDENAPEQEWREWAMDVAGVVRKRATLVRKAFRPPFNLSVIAEI